MSLFQSNCPEPLQTVMALKLSVYNSIVHPVSIAHWKSVVIKCFSAKSVNRMMTVCGNYRCGACSEDSGRHWDFFAPLHLSLLMEDGESL